MLRLAAFLGLCLQTTSQARTANLTPPSLKRRLRLRLGKVLWIRLHWRPGIGLWESPGRVATAAIRARERVEDEAAVGDAAESSVRENAQDGLAAPL